MKEPKGSEIMKKLDVVIQYMVNNSLVQTQSNLAREVREAQIVDMWLKSEEMRVVREDARESAR